MFGDLIAKVADYQGELLRNIKGIRISQSLFDDLAIDDADLQVAVAAEAATRIPSGEPLISRPFDYGSVITWPFVPYNWQATRFSDGLRYGVWYGSLDIETTVYETVYHWHRFIMDSYAAEDRNIMGERRVFRVHCAAILIDLRAAEDKAPELVARETYAFTHVLGRHLQEQNQNGLLVCSARCAGVNAAIFRAGALSSPRDQCYLSYSLNPAEDSVRVRRSRKLWLTLQPSTLY